MQQYKDLLRDIIENGEDTTDRTGNGTRYVWGRQLHFDLRDGFPIVTIRHSPFRIIFEETMMFLRGETDTKEALESKGINIWKYHTSREFLDSRKLFNTKEGDMGKGYGFQIREFNADKMKGRRGIDQLSRLIKNLKADPTGRRHIITHWNPNQIEETSLPPCHLYHQYKVHKDYLDSFFLMRSSDYVLAAGNFNIPQYALINHIIANVLDLQPRNLVYTAADVHIYNSHMEGAKELIKRTPLPLPELKIHKNLRCVQDIVDLKYEDVELIGYKNHGKMKFPLTG